MCMHIKAYRAPTRSTVETWAGRCTLPALELAIEVPGHNFPAKFRMLVEEAGMVVQLNCVLILLKGIHLKV